MKQKILCVVWVMGCMAWQSMYGGISSFRLLRNENSYVGLIGLEEERAVSSRFETQFSLVEEFVRDNCGNTFFCFMIYFHCDPHATLADLVNHKLWIGILDFFDSLQNDDDRLHVEDSFWKGNSAISMLSNKNSAYMSRGNFPREKFVSLVVRQINQGFEIFSEANVRCFCKTSFLPPCMLLVLPECEVARVAGEIKCSALDIEQLEGDSTLFFLAKSLAESCYRVCALCRMVPNFGQIFQACGQCRRTRYCSRKCQRLDWDRHKLLCGSS